ncbi:carboxypeptidase-like regulatory domain-containing protein [Paenibacillus sp. P26]|nr:carboxypeptidase-like regulatory domain-containing protein [Paenibacillus sp. P26]
MSGATVYASNVSGSVTTDASGRYTLHVPAGTYANVTAYAAGYPSYIQNNIQVSAGNTTTVNFSYGAVSGTVKDANGNPVPGATVLAYNVSGSTTTDANGKYRLNMAPGTYTLTVSKPGYPTESKTNIQVTAGQTTTVNFGEFSSGTISGTVTNASGHPVSGVTIFAANVPGTVTTDASGNYTLNVPAGTYAYVQAYATGYASYNQKNIQVTAGNTTTVNFSYGAITGTVKDANGDPVSGATVSNGAISQTTNAGGSYTLNVPPGTYTVTVFKTGYPTDSKNNIQVTAGQSTTVNFGVLRSTAPLPANITVVNNAAGTPDTITVNGLTAGDVIKVYNAETGGNLLATSSPVISGQSSVTASVYQLGAAAGYVYVSVTSTGQAESTRTAAAYGAEPADAVAPVTKYRLTPIYAQSSTGKPYIKGFTVTLQATDHQSGVKVINYRENGGAWTAYTAPFTIYAETTHTVNYFSTDNAGNAETPVNTMDFDNGTFTGAGSF